MRKKRPVMDIRNARKWRQRHENAYLHALEVEVRGLRHLMAQMEAEIDPNLPAVYCELSRYSNRIAALEESLSRARQSGYWRDYVCIIDGVKIPIRAFCPKSAARYAFREAFGPHTHTDSSVVWVEDSCYKVDVRMMPSVTVERIEDPPQKSGSPKNEVKAATPQFSAEHLRERIKARLAHRRKRKREPPAPRYDELYEQGVKWLEDHTMADMEGNPDIEGCPVAEASFQPTWVSTPGDTLEYALERQGLTQTQLAERTGFSQKLVNDLIQGRAAIDSDMAMRLESAVGGSAEFWLAREALGSDTEIPQRG